MVHNALELGESLKTRWENFFCSALAMMAAGSLSGVLGSLRRGLRGVPPGDLEGVHQKINTPSLHCVTWLNALTWQLLSTVHYLFLPAVMDWVLVSEEHVIGGPCHQCSPEEVGWVNNHAV